MVADLSPFKCLVLPKTGDLIPSPEEYWHLASTLDEALLPYTGAACASTASSMREGNMENDNLGLEGRRRTRRTNHPRE